MELFWNPDLVENITKSGNNMTVQGNDVTIAVTHKSKVPGYKQDLWFIKDSTTNVFSTKNLIRQYRVTYNSILKTFVVQREDQEKSNI